MMIIISPVAPVAVAVVFVHSSTFHFSPLLLLLLFHITKSVSESLASFSSIEISSLGFGVSFCFSRLPWLFLSHSCSLCTVACTDAHFHVLFPSSISSSSAAFVHFLAPSLHRFHNKTWASSVSPHCGAVVASLFFLSETTTVWSATAAYHQSDASPSPPFH